MPSKGGKRNDTRPDKRGNNTARRRRKQFLLDKFGDGTLTTCSLRLSPKCLVILDIDTLTVDRHPTPGRDGGTYRRHNIRPACKPCQDTQGANVTKGVDSEQV